MSTNRNCLFLMIAASCLSLVLPQCSSRRGGTTTASNVNDTLRTVDSSATTLSASSGAMLTYEERQGKVLFLKYCAVCHGTEGKGDGFNAFNLDPRPRDLSDKQYMSAFSKDRLYQTIELGGRGMNKSPSMPSWGGRLNRQDIRYVVSFVQSMSTR